MTYANTFRRREIKYLLTEEQKEAVIKAVRPYMQEDRYSGETISSLYCDNSEDILVRTSLDKPVYKEKLRLRAYGTPTDDSSVFLEIKKKYDGVVYKRRTKMTCVQAMDYLNGGKYPERESYNDVQVMSEIDYMVKRYGLFPRTAVFYDRRSFYGNDDKELRLTLDNNVRFRRDRLDLRLGSDGMRLTDQPFCIMEIKEAATIPLWLAQVLSELLIFPGSFSKYGQIYADSLEPVQTGILTEIAGELNEAHAS